MVTETSPMTTTTSEQITNMSISNTDNTTQTDISSNVMAETITLQTDQHDSMSIQNNMTKDTDNSNPLLSAQPQFSTAEIVKKIPHMKHRYCHKIKISLPWDDKTAKPTSETYYKAIYSFFKLVKSYNDQFQILTWDIVNK
jgi:hypothetical protein